MFDISCLVLVNITHFRLKLCLSLITCECRGPVQEQYLLGEHYKAHVFRWLPKKKLFENLILRLRGFLPEQLPS